MNIKFEEPKKNAIILIYNNESILFKKVEYRLKHQRYIQTNFKACEEVYQN